MTTPAKKQPARYTVTDEQIKVKIDHHLDESIAALDEAHKLITLRMNRMKARIQSMKEMAK